jgi:dihydrolipoamide dehydrogenase
MRSWKQLLTLSILFSRPQLKIARHKEGDFELFGFKNKERDATLWSISSLMNNYQLAIIGSGSGGREATLLAARKGLRTALIERDRLGGTCFHRGCYAVLALQACARQFRDSWRSGRFGNKVGLLKETLSGWMTVQSNVSSRLVDTFRADLERLNVHLYQGYGQLLDNRTIQVIDARGSKTNITADNVIVATGSRPDIHRSPGTRVVNSDQLLSMPTVPGKLAIIGAGYIGCEFASIYSTLGCEVTLIEKEGRVLSGWESEAGERVAEMLEMRGVTIQVDRNIFLDQIKEHETGVRIPEAGGQSVEADLVLVATGRKPNSEELGLGALGIEDNSFLKVDQSMRLPSPGLYALGDVNGISLLDSTAFSQASVAINSILGHESRLDYRWIPRCIHTEPSVAAVGWTQQEAAAQGIECLTVSDTIRLVSDSERSLVDPEPTFLKVVVDSRSRHLLGCLVAGDHAPVIANIAAIAMRSGLTVDKLREIPLAQPSASDVLMAILRKLD